MTAMVVLVGVGVWAVLQATGVIAPPGTGGPPAGTNKTLEERAERSGSGPLVTAPPTATSTMTPATPILSSSSEDRYLTPEERAAGPGEHFDGLSRTHLRDGVEYTSYTTTPPVGGPHWPAAAAWGIYDEPVPEERQVHDLEHGGVLIQYNTDDQQVVDRLETIVNDLPGSPSCLMLAPYPDMEHTIALTAWGVMQTMDEVDEQAIREFADFYRDQGPERLSCRNDTEELRSIEGAPILSMPTPTPLSPGSAATMEDGTAFSMRSTAFQGGRPVPRRYTCDGEDVSPPLSWDDVPGGTQDLVLIVDDPDAPGGVFTHWVLYGLSAGTSGLQEGVPAEQHLENGTAQGKNDFGTIGYKGPCPPPGDPHRYRFTLYALDSAVDPGAAATRQQIVAGLEGHVLARARLVGTYSRQASIDFSITLKGEAGSGYAFAPDTMELEAGKTYSIKLVSTAEFHTWTVVDTDGSYIKNVSVNGGETKTIEFTAPDAGTYELICLPHQALGMTGEIVVR